LGIRRHDHSQFISKTINPKISSGLAVAAIDVVPRTVGAGNGGGWVTDKWALGHRNGRVGSNGLNHFQIQMVQEQSIFY
jgi:hypothetical protein